jgi:NAD+ diphosphatase
MTFNPALHPASDSIRSKWWFLFRGDRILVRRGEDASVRPFFTDVSFVEAGLMHSQYLGRLNDIDCFAAELSSKARVSSAAELQQVRQLLGAVDDELAAVAGRANQMIHWARTHQFCGLCGHVTRDAENERILLARSTRIGASFYSVLAGFVEPGETLEECVSREICEEVGLRVTDIRYFGSQPWPFPNALMVAFTARYAGGEIRLNPSEIAAADWFSAGALPPVPGRWSIARRLIDWFEKTEGRR